MTGPSMAPFNPAYGALSRVCRQGQTRLCRVRRADKEKPPAQGRGKVNREASRLGDAGVIDPFPATWAGTLADQPPYPSTQTLNSSGRFVHRQKTAAAMPQMHVVEGFATKSGMHYGLMIDN